MLVLVEHGNIASNSIVVDFVVGIGLEGEAWKARKFVIVFF